ncbi:MAG TPA: ABC transporter permease, partial [Gemmatimonadales bacterium]|nr:ABC transporter permease [Gemmatimonadales bacterium]
MTPLGWSLKSLLRHRLRTALSVVGIAISAALLLDMVMLSGGIEQSFAELVLARGYQIRLTPKGTLPFDTEATLPLAGDVVRAIRRDPSVEAAGAVLGTSVYGSVDDSLITLFGYGIQPEAQALYTMEAGRDLHPSDTSGVLLSAPAARLLRAEVGDTIVLVGRLDPQVITAAERKDLIVRGLVHWIYDYRDQPSVGATLVSIVIAPVNQSTHYQIFALCRGDHLGIETANQDNGVAHFSPKQSGGRRTEQDPRRIARMEVTPGLHGIERLRLWLN